MKFYCSKAMLQHAVQAVQKAIATKTPLPILTGIYLSAANNRLELQTTDYDMAISCSIEANIEQPGKAVVSGRFFQELVRRLPGETVEISSNQEDSTLRISCNSSNFNLLCFPYEEFPVIEKIQTSTNKLTLKDNVLRDIIKKTVFACATDESRPIFTGGLFEAENDSIKMVGTNTHRLALKQDIIAPVELPAKMIIPAKLLNELARSLSSDVPVDVNIYWEKGHVAFEFDDIYLKSRLIEGSFPDYNRVIPAKFETVVFFDTHAFLDAAERVSLMAKDGDYNIIKFRFEQDMITLSSNNPDVGKASETVAATMQGPGLEIAFNAKYVTDILKNLGSDKATLSLNNPLSPACIRPADSEKYTYVITPVRTS
ncbi:MAG: polymerase beta subunit [Anaerosporomusa subterranea]|nr:polymerase beta subunit [Anaerosporomusa subterranea]